MSNKSSNDKTTEFVNANNENKSANETIEFVRVNHSNPLIRYAPKPEPVIQDHNGESNNIKVHQVANVDEVEMGKR